MFPISRDPPEGGTWPRWQGGCALPHISFQFLGIPPKGEHINKNGITEAALALVFPISRDPPEGGTRWVVHSDLHQPPFPISRDPPEGGRNRRLSGS